MAELLTCSLSEIVTPSSPKQQPTEIFVTTALPPILQSPTGAEWVAQVLCWVALHGIPDALCQEQVAKFARVTTIPVDSQETARMWLRDLAFLPQAGALLQKYDAHL